MLSVIALAVASAVAAQQGEKPSVALTTPGTDQPLDPFDAAARFSPSLQDNLASQEFLHPDVAFVLSADAADPDTVRVRWTIADGYYLYRDKFKFSVKDEEGSKIGSVTFPSGKMKEDEYFGRVEVFYNSVEGAVSLERTAEGVIELTLDIKYQGCAEAGLCYPPITKSVPLSLPAGSGPPKDIDSLTPPRNNTN